jgi:hypothetical protein
VHKLATSTRRRSLERLLARADVVRASAWSPVSTTLDQWQSAQIAAVSVQQIEREYHQLAPTASHAPQVQPENRWRPAAGTALRR